MKTLVVFISLITLSSLPITSWANQESKNSHFTQLPQQEKWNLLLGSWYGTLPTINGEAKKQIISHNVSGRYQSRVRSRSENGEVKTISETGYWGISGDIYFSIFLGWVTDKGAKRAHSSNPSHYNAYHITGFADQTLMIKHASSGKQYTLEKVPNNFRFPD